MSKVFEFVNEIIVIWKRLIEIISLKAESFPLSAETTIVAIGVIFVVAIFVKAIKRGSDTPSFDAERLNWVATCK